LGSGIDASTDVVLDDVASATAAATGGHQPEDINA
jgi:hypothetical protein